MVAGIRDVHVARAVESDSPWRSQLAGFLRQRTARVPRLRTAAPLGQQLRQHIRARIEFLDTMVTHIHNIDGAVRLIDGDATGEIKLAVAVTEAAPGHDELAGHVELLHTEVGAVDHIDVPAHAIHGDAPGRVELPFAVAARAELHEVPAQFAVELLDAMVVRVDHPHVTLAVARDAGRIVEVGVSRAEVSPQNDEVAGIVELLDPVVAVIDDEHRALLVHTETVDRRHELAAVQQRRAAAGSSPLRYAEIARRID